jgi:hypothetical protein
VNHVNAGPVNDRGKYLILKASSAEASPSYIRYRTICSIVQVPSCPENMVNSAGTFTLFGMPPCGTIPKREVYIRVLGS